jgi:hypothetical protein
LDQQKIKKAVRKFSDLIERNKDWRAYSDYKEGVNKGLQIAKNTFDENAEKFVLSDSDGGKVAKMQSLQDRFNLIIDMTVVKEKPNYSQDHLDGIYEGFKRSKKLFGEFINELYSS